MAKLFTFDGQHSDERILYVVKEYELANLIQMVKLVGVGILVFAGLGMIGQQLPSVGGWLVLLGFILGLVIGGGGLAVAILAEKKNRAYVTDRRIIRFKVATPWVVNSRSLMWSEAVKVKTYPPNYWWRLMNVGNLVVHARSTILSDGQDERGSELTNDDVELSHVYYYRDLGNYIDKIIYLYRTDRGRIGELKPFVAKPKGKRG